jgi:hypothetical protein
VTLYTNWKNVYKRPPTERERLRGKAPTTHFGRMCERLEASVSTPKKRQIKRKRDTPKVRATSWLLAEVVDEHDFAEVSVDLGVKELSPVW